MSMRFTYQTFFIAIVTFLTASVSAQRPSPGQPVYKDVAYLQKFNIKYLLREEKTQLKKIACDRNGNVEILSSAGLLKPSGGALLYPGELMPDLAYKPIKDIKISDLTVYDDQFVYLGDRAILSNAWAGKLYLTHTMPGADKVCGGNDFSFLIADGNAIQYVNAAGVIWSGKCEAKILDILFDRPANTFWILSENAISVFGVKNHDQKIIFKGKGFTSFALSRDKKTLIAGTHQGYWVIDVRKGGAMVAFTISFPAMILRQ